MADIRESTQEAMSKTDFAPFVKDGKIFYEWIAGFRDAIIDKTIDSMRPKWGCYPGFDAVVKSHAERMFFETYLH